MPELETQAELEHDATKAVLEAIDWDELTDNLTGRSGFRTSDPRDTYDDLTRFIWRKAAFKTGINDSIPVMAHSWLQAWLDEQDINARVIGMSHDGKSEEEQQAHEAGEEIKDVLDVVAELVLHHFGRRSDVAAQRWKGLLY